jgi:DNA polymerase-3 subunit beta
MNSMTLVHSHAGPSALLERDDLVAALDIAIGASARKHTIPILNTVRMSYSTEFERCIVVTTTDLDCQVSINVRANVSDEFSAAVPVQTFRDILRKIPETERNRLALELLAAPPERRRVEDGDGNETWEEVRRNSFVSDRMQVRLGRATFELKSLPVDDFPEMPAFTEDPHEITVAGSALWNALDAVKGGMSTEETRNYLNGAYLHVVGPDTLALTATDGHRLFRQEIRGVQCPADMQGVIVPAATVNLLHGLLRGKGCPREVDLYVSADRLAVNWGPVSLLSKTIDGTYPDYGRVIPTGNDKVAVVRPGWFIGAVEAVTAIASERGRAVRLAFERGKVTLSVSNPDTGHSEMSIDCAYDAEPLDIGFNAASLTELIAKASPDKDDVTLRLADVTSPVLVTGSIEGWSGVLMPMRV